MSFSHSDEAAKRIWVLFEALNPTVEQRKEMTLQMNRFRKLTIIDIDVAWTKQTEILKAKAGDYWTAE